MKKFKWGVWALFVEIAIICGDFYRNWLKLLFYDIKIYTIYKNYVENQSETKGEKTLLNPKMDYCNWN